VSRETCRSNLVPGSVTFLRVIFSPPGTYRIMILRPVSPRKSSCPGAHAFVPERLLANNKNLSAVTGAPLRLMLTKVFYSGKKTFGHKKGL
jgi:hypothetical protein